MIRAIRISSRTANTEKVKKFQETDVFVKDLKNRISKYIYDHLQEMLDDHDEFIRNYNKFNDKEKRLTAWETQTIFHDICGLYKNTLDQRRKKLDTSTQIGVKITYYKKKVNLRNGITKNKGDIKSYSIIKKYSNLTKFIKLLVFLDRNNLDKYKEQKIYEVISHYQKNKNWSRILKVADQLHFHLMQKVKLIEFTTGTYRINLKGDEFIIDETNNQYKHWFKYKGHHYPLLIEGRNPKKYHKDLSLLKKEKNKQVSIKVKGNRIDFLFTQDYEPKFKEQLKVIGLDINIKNNFCTTSERQIFDYDRRYIHEFIDEIKKIDAIGYQNISVNQQKHLEKIIGKNEWYFKKLISEVLDQFVKDNVTDIVMEDFDNNTFKSSIISSVEFKEKYTRLIRLLRLGNIKKWMLEQGEKRGIRVHITQAPYSSQECPKCHYIDHLNRQSQEEFECISCNHKDNADFISPQNLKNRFLSDVLKTKLHTLDDFGRMIPKIVGREKLKEILSSFSSPLNVLYKTSECLKHSGQK